MPFKLRLSVGLFILFWTIRFLYLDICFFKIGKFSARISSDTFLNFPFAFTLLLGFLLCIDWHALCYPIGLIYSLKNFCGSDWVICIILPSRSLIHSYGLFSLLFVAFSLTFILENEFYNWLLFMVSRSFYTDLYFDQ